MRTPTWQQKPIARHFSANKWHDKVFAKASKGEKRANSTVRKSTENLPVNELSESKGKMMLTVVCKEDGGGPLGHPQGERRQRGNKHGRVKNELGPKSKKDDLTNLCNKTLKN